MRRVIECCGKDTAWYKDKSKNIMRKCGEYNLGCINFCGDCQEKKKVKDANSQQSEMEKKKMNRELIDFDSYLKIKDTYVSETIDESDKYVIVKFMKKEVKFANSIKEVQEKKE